MTDDAVTLSDIEMLFQKTVRRGATPHREPDFKVIREILEREGQDQDPAIGYVFSLVEEHNTGYNGLLIRYLLQCVGTKITFQVDLLPGLLFVGKPADAAA